MLKETLPIIYQDDTLIAVNKPSGLLVHRSELDRHETRFALQILRDQVGRRVYPVHRLDKPTSGLLLMAFSSDTARALAHQFEAGTPRKRYLAIVRGHPPLGGIIRHPLQDPDDPRGDQAPLQDALTVYHRLATTTLPISLDSRYPTARYALMHVKLCTGRRHQIRRHFKHISHHLIGDSNYGKGNHNRYLRDHYGCSRLMLCAIGIDIIHPETGTLLQLQAEPSPDFTTAAQALGWQDALARPFTPKNPHPPTTDDSTIPAPT